MVHVRDDAEVTDVRGHNCFKAGEVYSI
jgi:hypothetical protein